MTVGNVIVFGETGGGKSSVINMLDGGDIAGVDDSAKGVTFHSVAYERTIKGQIFKIFDTAGLNQDARGIAFAQDADKQLRKLIRELPDGVNLLVYVVQASRILDSAIDNYKLFYEAFCEAKVPIVIVITHLEGKDDMDQWWMENKPAFDVEGMTFKASACITATKGKIRAGVPLYEKEYEASKRKVEDLIFDHYMQTPWVKSADDVFSRVRNYISRWLRPWVPQNEQPPDIVRNVIMFGETGSGKSSVINLLDGGDSARVSNRAGSAAFQFSCYEKTIEGQIFRVFGTVGLDEGSKGTVPARDAVERLYMLVRQLSDGIGLLVYVMQAPRIKASAIDNYKLFYEVFCEKQVPVVIVITGLEGRHTMDDWWRENEPSFDRYKMSFKASACITSTKGKRRNEGYLYEEEYEESKKEVEKLILTNCMAEPWARPTKGWFASILSWMKGILAKFFPLEPVALSHTLYEALRNFGGLSEEEARARAYELERV